MTSNQERDDMEPGYETRDVNIRVVLVTTIVSVALLVGVVAILYGYFITTKEAVYQKQVLEPVARDFTALQAGEDSVLTSYELIDTAKGTYRVPIERAMELMAVESGQSESGQ